MKFQPQDSCKNRFFMQVSTVAESRTNYVGGIGDDEGNTFSMLARSYLSGTYYRPARLLRLPVF